MCSHRRLAKSRGTAAPTSPPRSLRGREVPKFQVNLLILYDYTPESTEFLMTWCIDHRESNFVPTSNRMRNKSQWKDFLNYWWIHAIYNFMIFIGLQLLLSFYLRISETLEVFRVRKRWLMRAPLSRLEGVMSGWRYFEVFVDRGTSFSNSTSRLGRPCNTAAVDSPAHNNAPYPAFQWRISPGKI